MSSNRLESTSSNSLDLEPTYVPHEYNDRQSIYSNLQSIKSEVKFPVTRTETQKSLIEKGLSSTIPTPGLNKAPVDDPIFPEEYTMETETGLVPLQLLELLGRTKTNKSVKEKAVNKNVQLVTFLPDDPENPHNWNTLLRWYYTIVLALMVISAAYGSSCLAGGLFTIEDKFKVSPVVSTLSVSFVVFGFAVGPLLWAPLSEQIGRRPVYIISFGLYVIFNIPCALAKNIETVLICRLLCGVFSASALTNVGASLVDLHDETRSLAIAFFSFAPYSGPVLGAIVNGFISVGTNRYDLMIWVNMAFAGVMWILVGLIPETYAPVILKRRAKKLRIETGDDSIMTEQELTPQTWKELINECLIRPLNFVITEPVLDLICAFIALIYSLLYAFFFAYPVIFSELYGYRDNIIGLMFVPIIIGAGLALTTTPVLEKKYAALIKRRPPQPEDRLIGAMIGSPFPCIALFILGATSSPDIIWVGPASSGIAFGYGMVLIYYSLNNYIIDTYAKYAASALATKVFLRSFAGGSFPIFTPQMYHNLGLRWASFLLAFISLAMIPIPFAFYKYGKTLRSKLCKEDYTAYN